MDNNVLHYACVYLNDDMAFHGRNWHIDAGKLATAIEFGERQAAMVLPKTDSDQQIVDEISAHQPKERTMLFAITVTVTMETFFRDKMEAIEWLHSNTVFDMLDRGAMYGEANIMDEDGNVVYSEG